MIYNKHIKNKLFYFSDAESDEDVEDEEGDHATKNFEAGPVQHDQNLHCLEFVQRHFS